MIERVPREYAELRIDLSRDALDSLFGTLCRACSVGLVSPTQDEIHNLRNVVQNLLDRFDAALTD